MNLYRFVVVIHFSYIVYIVVSLENLEAQTFLKKLMKKFNYVLEFDILKNSSQKTLGVLRGYFSWFGCIKDTKMPCCLRLFLMEESFRKYLKKKSVKGRER